MAEKFLQEWLRHGYDKPHGSIAGARSVVAHTLWPSVSALIQCIDSAVTAAGRSLRLHWNKQQARIPVLVCSELKSVIVHILRAKHPAIDQDFVFHDQAKFTEPLGCCTSWLQCHLDQQTDGCVLALTSACVQSANKFLAVPIDSGSSFPKLWKLLRLILNLPAAIVRSR